MTTDYRALCAELADELSGYASANPHHDSDALVARARAALAQPVAAPAEPTDEQLTLTYAYAVAKAVGNRRGPFSATDAEAAQLAGLRAVLARWGNHFPDVKKMVSPAPVTAEGEVVDAKHVRRMCDIILGNTFGNEELDSLALLVGHHPDVLNAAPAPAEGEVADYADFVAWLVSEMPAGTVISDPLWWAPRIARRAADLLEQRHPAPVPVSERLPGPEDCDAEGFCWWFSPADPAAGTFGVAACWVLRKPEPEDDFRTHWLPATALPLPQGEVE